MSLKLRLLIVLTAAPYLYLLGINSLEHYYFAKQGFLTDWSALNLPFYPLVIGVAVVWSLHIKRNRNLTRDERRLWWALVWLVGALGQVAYIHLKVVPRAQEKSA